jgi:hypothetical protein
MQAPPTSQRSIQRRSPAADPGPPPTVPARSISPGPGNQPRISSSSSKAIANGGSRRQNVSTAARARSPSLHSTSASFHISEQNHFEADILCELDTFSAESKQSDPSSPSITDREERYPPPSSDKAASRDPYTMVSTPGYGCASLRCVRQIRI